MLPTGMNRARPLPMPAATQSPTGLPVGIGAPQQGAQVGAPMGAPAVQIGNHMGTPHMGVNVGEIGVPWAQRFSK